jgi:hypothetical protein
VDSFNVPTDELFSWFDAKRLYVCLLVKKKERKEIGNENRSKRENE